MTALNKHVQLRKELSNPAIGSNHHLRKLALSLLNELEASQKYAKDRDAENEDLMLTVGRLRMEKEAAEKRIAELQSDVIAPGIMRCAGCGFVLTKNNINMTAGTITAGDSKTEPCPNGCGPLWPVTWKEQALQMRDDSESWFLELQEAKNRIAELEAREQKNLTEERQRVIDGLCAIGETAWEIEEYMKEWDAKHQRKATAAGIGVKGD
ncbi:hypothetical protein ACXQAU_002749 [Citrobacter freundii]